MVRAQDQSGVITFFLAYQRLWAALLLLGWLMLNVVINATTTYMEAHRESSTLLFWEPLCWEVTSALVLYGLFWPIALLLGRWRTLPSDGRITPWAGLVLVHLMVLCVFSVTHVSLMVLLRKLWYAVLDSHYVFGPIGYEFLYELRKDAITYLSIIIIVSVYRFIVRRLRGEASLLQQSENHSTPLPDKLLIKKLGKEFLIAVDTIDWIEAAGNYANLHVGSHVFPMRITMTKLSGILPTAQFIRIHRSTIVNSERVVHIQPLNVGDYEVVLQDGTQLNLSRRYRDAFKEQWRVAG